MKIVILYDSLYGNTEKIARAMSKTLAQNQNVKLISVNKAKMNDFEKVDLLIVGSPTQGGRPTKALSEFLDKLPANKLASIKVAAFDTRFQASDQGVGLRLLMKIIDFAAPKILVSLQSKGGEKVAAEGFIVIDKEGPLLDGEIKRSASWARSLLTK